MKLLILDDDNSRHSQFLTHYVGHSIKSVYTASGAIKALKKEKYDYVFLDHDLGGQQMVKSGDGTGYEVAEFIALNLEYAPVREVVLHSLNPIGRKNMKDVLTRYGVSVIDAPGCWRYGKID